MRWGEGEGKRSRKRGRNWRGGKEIEGRRGDEIGRTNRGGWGRLEGWGVRGRQGGLN